MTSIAKTFTVAACVVLFGGGCWGAPKPAETERSAESAAPTTGETTDTAATTTATTTAPAQPAPKPATTTTKPKPSTAPAPTTKTVVVTITGSKFSPQIVAANPGDTILWVNKDTLPHTTRSDGSLLWDSGTIRPGGSFKRVFTSIGSYSYSCAIHPGMKGTVVINAVK